MGQRNALAYAKLRRIVGNPPGNVMHGSDAPLTAGYVGLLADLEVASRAAGTDAVAMPTVVRAETDEAKRPGQERRRECEVSLEQANRVESHDLARRRDGTLIPRREFAGVRRLDQRE